MRENQKEQIYFLSGAVFFLFFHPLYEQREEDNLPKYDLLQFDLEFICDIGVFCQYEKKLVVFW